MLRRSALLALLACAACSQPKPPSSYDAGTVHNVGRNCDVDDECRAGSDGGVTGNLRCDTVRHVCICTSDQDCADLDPNGVLVYCNNFTGLCVESVAGCTADKECPAASYCDQDTRSCKVRKGFCEQCSDDLECGADADDCLYDSSLKASFCGQFCTATAECPANAECTDFSGKKQCWPKAGKNCKIFMGCTPDSKASCTTTADCSAVPDQICDPGSGLCVARNQICPFGQICDSKSRICVDACSSDADCIAIASNLRCVNRACEPLGECSATAADPSGDKGCPANKVCSFNPGMTFGTCVPFCGSDQECAQGTICTATSEGRRKCQAGCRVPADCPLDKTCIKPGGSTIGTCQGTPGATCQTDQACPACGTCDVSTFGCSIKSKISDGFCRSCGTDQDCGNGHCLTLNGGIQRCGQPCPATGCPRGFVCNEICVNGTYQGFKCTGNTYAECIPVDQSCTNADSSEKCLDCIASDCTGATPVCKPGVGCAAQ